MHALAFMRIVFQGTNCTFEVDADDRLPIVRNVASKDDRVVRLEPPLDDAAELDTAITYALKLRELHAFARAVLAYEVELDADIPDVVKTVIAAKGVIFNEPTTEGMMQADADATRDREMRIRACARFLAMTTTALEQVYYDVTSPVCVFCVCPVRTWQALTSFQFGFPGDNYKTGLWIIKAKRVIEADIDFARESDESEREQMKAIPDWLPKDTDFTQWAKDSHPVDTSSDDEVKAAFVDAFPDLENNWFDVEPPSSAAASSSSSSSSAAASSSAGAPPAKRVAV